MYLWNRFVYICIKKKLIDLKLYNLSNKTIVNSKHNTSILTRFINIIHKLDKDTLTLDKSLKNYIKSKSVIQINLR